MSPKTEQDMKSGINEHREHCQDEPPDVYTAEATLGTITVPEEKQESCYARSPQPSSDPNDPLVSLQPLLVMISKRYQPNSALELARVGEVCHSRYDLLLHLPGYRQRQQFCSWDSSPC